ncbi:MAG: hypothetical protein ABI175_28960 [Polyangiales bacterium]
MKPRGVAGVSKVVKSLAVIALIGAAILVWYLRRDRAAQSATAPAAVGTAQTSASAPGPRPPAHVKRVTAEERKQIAAQIENARKGRAATSAPAGPSLPAQTPAPSLPKQAALSADDPEQFKTTMKAAMREVIPYLAECYDKAPNMASEVNIVAKLTLLGDPDIGTLIDTDGIADSSNGALPSDFDSCLRDSLAGLQLPPLAEGEEVKVTYPFMFTR